MHADMPQRSVSFGQNIVKLQRADGGSLALQKGLFRRHCLNPNVTEQYLAVGQSRVRKSKVRIQRERPPRVFDPTVCIFFCTLVEEEATLEIKFIGLSISCMALHQALFLRA